MMVKQCVQTTANDAGAVQVFLRKNAIFFVLIFAFLLRLPGLFARSLWGDEVATLVLSHWPMKSLLLRPIDPTPFLYYMLHQALVGDQANAALVRVPSLVFGVASVAVIFKAGTLLLGRRAGLQAAVMLAVSNIAIYYSDEARAYSLTLLLTLLMTLAVVAHDKAANRLQRFASLALYGCSAVAAFYTHLTAGYWILATAPMFLLPLLRKPETRLSICLMFGLMLVCALPGLARLHQQTQVGFTFNWLVQATPVRFVSNLADLLLPSGFADAPILQRHGLSNAVKIVLLGAAGFSALFGWRVIRQRTSTRSWAIREDDSPYVYAIIVASLGLTVGIWLQGYVAKPIFMPRTVLFCLPGFIFLFTVVLRGLEAKTADRFLAVWAGINCLAIAAAGFALPTSDWRGLSVYLAQNVRAGDAVLVEPGYEYGTMRYAVQQSMPGVAGLMLNKVPVVAEACVGCDPDWIEHMHRMTAFGPFRAEAGLPVDPGLLPVTLTNFRRVWIVARSCRSASQPAARSVWQDGRRMICVLMQNNGQAAGQATA